MVSPLFFQTISNKAYAETIQVNNPSFIGTFQETSTAFSEVVESIKLIIEWIKNLPENITSFSVELISNIYNLTSQLILKTPLWLFDNQWFENTTYLFSILAIGIVTVFTMFEGFKRKIQKKYVDLKTIGKRWFLVAGLTSILPFITLNFFKFLNFLSEQIISLGVHQMNNPSASDLSAFDVFSLLMFSAALVAMTIPILLKNARRFFDIAVLIIISPLASVGYIFNSYKHLFDQWWENLKRLSLVQVVYAFFLLIIGLLIYGIPTPDDTVGIMFKLLIILGGFFRLMNPPQFVQKYLDPGEGIDDTIGKQFRTVRDGITKYVAKTGTVIGRGARVVQFLSRGRSVQTVSTNTMSRMSRLHGR